MTQDINNPKHWTADEGKTFKRIVDDFIMGNDMYLGLYMDGSEDTIENYEEVDKPTVQETTTLASQAIEHIKSKNK